MDLPDSECTAVLPLPPATGDVGIGRGARQHSSQQSLNSGGGGGGGGGGGEGRC